MDGAISSNLRLSNLLIVSDKLSGYYNCNIFSDFIMSLYIFHLTADSIQRTDVTLISPIHGITVGE